MLDRFPCPRLIDPSIGGVPHIPRGKSKLATDGRGEELGERDLSLDHPGASGPDQQKFPVMDIFQPMISAIRVTLEALPLSHPRPASEGSERL